MLPGARAIKVKTRIVIPRKTGTLIKRRRTMKVVIDVPAGHRKDKRAEWLAPPPVVNAQRGEATR
jgi:hypothetical protein